jgi:multicomponent Na+:H+ antiporter subunit A
VAIGVLGYLFWDRLRRLISLADPLWQHGADAGFWLLLDGVTRFADALTRLLMAGGLRRYMLWTILTIAVAPAAALFFRGGISLPAQLPALHFTEWVLVTVIATAAIGATAARGRLTAIAAIGVVGFTVALLFEMLSAPDLAITQLMVETLFVVIVVLIIQHLPALGATEPANWLLASRNFVVAVGVGSLVTLLIWSVTTLPFSSHVSDYYARESVPSAYGRNIVNVVLVDFRATDTLGEITVLAVAALGVLTLLKLRKGQTHSKLPEDETR